MDEMKKLAALLRSLANQVERSSPEELEELLSGTRPFRPRVKGPPSTKTRTRSIESFSKIADDLRQFESRDEGQRLLERLELNRIDLERLAREMNLPVSKQDNLERLREKIVESSIGSRLVSRAIRGDP